MATNQTPSNPDQYQEVENPTWHQNIKLFFRDFDINCMKEKGIRLNVYDDVKNKSSSIYSRVKRREGSRKMPMDLTWHINRVKTFKNWAKNDFPVGQLESVNEVSFRHEEDSALRIRKNINNLSLNEVTKLKIAFKGLMDKSETDELSYFKITGYHGYPLPSECVHGSEQFNHWHRLYLLQMENALRTIPDCEDVTIPYWDITETDIPELLNDDLFKNYTLPSGHNYTTYRNSNNEILKLITHFQISRNIEIGLNEPWFEDYWMRLEDNAHDTGHGSISGSNSNPTYASFDPIFWFFHCNWDRLFWIWQKKNNATTNEDFIDKLRSDVDWLEGSMKSGAISTKSKYLTDSAKIDLRELGLGDDVVSIDYDTTIFAIEEVVALNLPHIKTNSISSSARFKLAEKKIASVMVKDVHRLNINGGFFIHLYSNEKIIGSTYEFQFLDPTKCPNCVKKAIRNYVIEVPSEKLIGELKVEIRLPDESNTLVEMIDVGNPTLNIRMVLE